MSTRTLFVFSTATTICSLYNTSVNNVLSLEYPDVYIYITLAFVC